MKFTIEEIKNYIKSKDSLGDVMYYLTEENIKAANQNLEFSWFQTWLTEKFQQITWDESNGESISEIDISRETNTMNKLTNTNSIIIDFIVDCDDYGYHEGNQIKISSDGTYKISLSEILESGGIPSALEELIVNEVLENDLTFEMLFPN